LRNLSAKAENQVRIAAESGLGHILAAAMGRHVDVPGLQEACCGALYNLSTNARNIAAIKAGGGLERLQAAIMQFALTAHTRTLCFGQRKLSEGWRNPGESFYVSYLSLLVF
jgi:hypothetical protein